MKEIVIQGTATSPEVVFAGNGELKLAGRSMPEDVNVLFNPLIDFVQGLNARQVKFDVNLEYFNTATSKVLADLFKHLDANSNVSEININWHYEEGDDDSLETAEIYEEMLFRSHFRYLEYAETAN